MPWGMVVGSVVAGGISALSGGSGKTSGARAARAQARATDEQTRQAQGMFRHWDESYKPVEQGLSREVMDAGSEAEQEEWAGKAGADVASAYQGQEGIRRRDMNASGINPGSPAYQAELASTGLQRAGDIAGAQTQARRYAKDLGFAKRMDFAGLGRNIPGQASAGLTSAANSYGNISRDAYLRSQNDQANAAYALAPVGNAVGNWVNNKASGWFGSGNPNAGAYNDMAKAASGFVSSKPSPNPFQAYSGYAEGGIVRGPGTETSDSIPAMVDGEQPVQLSNNEMIVNAEGARIMDEVAPGLLDAVNMLGMIARYSEEEGIQRGYKCGGKVKKRMYASGGRASVYADDVKGPKKPLRSASGPVKSAHGTVMVRDFDGGIERNQRGTQGELITPPPQAPGPIAHMRMPQIGGQPGPDALGRASVFPFAPGQLDPGHVIYDENGNPVRVPPMSQGGGGVPAEDVLRRSGGSGIEMEGHALYEDGGVRRRIPGGWWRNAPGQPTVWGSAMNRGRS